ncbi:MAG TPA: DUF6456 domain-containing protein [Sphingomicrobium sp.]|jgi:hypothetical protein|nr:DUF6456 domain-containing protein [Sphingomicrobium sp.]
MRLENGRLLQERAVGGEAKRSTTPARPTRSVTVNVAESPLGWLKARGHISNRQYDAGEQLRLDWERSQLAPSVTMRWDAAPISKGRSGSSGGWHPAESQMKARERFDAAVAAAGPGLSDILWRVVCAGEGMREAEDALGWPARAGKLVLTLALDRVADFYRMA